MKGIEKTEFFDIKQLPIETSYGSPKSHGLKHQESVKQQVSDRRVSESKVLDKFLTLKQADLPIEFFGETVAQNFLPKKFNKFST